VLSSEYRNGVTGQIVRQRCPFRNIAHRDCSIEVGEAVGKNAPVENRAYFLSFASCFAISANSRGFSSARTLSTIFESASLPEADCGGASAAGCAAGASFWDEPVASGTGADDSAIASVARSVMTVSRIRCQLSHAAEDSDPAGGPGSELLTVTAFVCAKDSEAEAAAANAAPDVESVSGADWDCQAGSGAGTGDGSAPES